MQINSSDESYERGETSKPASSAHASASSSSQRVTLKSFYHTIENDPTRVRCKLCAMVGIEKVIFRDNFSKHVKDIHEAIAREKEKCVHCGKMYRRSTIKKHIQVVHGDENNIQGAREKEKCAQCGKMVSRSYIKGHMKYVHGDEKTRRGSCGHCGKLITKKNLSTHRKLCAQKNKELEEDN